MTEKRFTVHRTIGMLSAFYVNDNLSDKVVIDQIIHKYEADRLCKKLNALNDENEQLKKFKEDVFDLIDKYIAECKRGEKSEAISKEELHRFHFLRHSLEMLKDEL